MGAVWLLFLLLPAGVMAGGEKGPGSRQAVRTMLLYPNGLSVNGSSAAFSPRVSGRSIPLAFGLSAVVPGLGQAYNRQWIKVGVALALEAGLIAGYTLWRQDGLNGVDAYELFAHARWDPRKYASWINDYKAYLAEIGQKNITAPDVTIPEGIDFMRPERWSVAERNTVKVFFSEIQAIERQSEHLEGPKASFSHQLPGFGEQQYYELIGKYFQFAPGWDDYPDWRDAENGFTAAIDPELTGEGNTKPNVSDTFWEYSTDHKHANGLLRKASRLSAFFVINHVLAAVDAAVSAKLHNDRLSTQMGLAYGPDGEAQPVATLTIRF